MCPAYLRPKILNMSDDDEVEKRQKDRKLIGFLRTMEHNTKETSYSHITSERKTILDYFFNEGDGLQVFQLVSDLPLERWEVLFEGFLMGRIKKTEGAWVAEPTPFLSAEKVFAIGNLIDQQHFNHLPEDIKKHWQAYVQEIIVQSDSDYMVICRKGIDFSHFKTIFTSFIVNFIQDEWPIDFYVYDADFAIDFHARVL